MAEAMPGGTAAEGVTDRSAPDLEAVGQEIDRLLDRLAEAGPGPARTAESLVRVLMDLYGTGLERVLATVDHATARDLADDALVAGLLSLHDLNPVAVVERVDEALGEVRSRLGTSENDLSIAGLEDGVLRLRREIGANGCGSSWSAIRDAVEAAVFGAAPEVVRIEVEGPPDDGSVLIPIESLRRRPREPTDPT